MALDDELNLLDGGGSWWKAIAESSTSRPFTLLLVKEAWAALAAEGDPVEGELQRLLNDEAPAGKGEG